MSQLTERFASLTTPHLADARVRLGVPVRCAPSTIQAMTPGMRIVGRVLPARHSGSVDVFLEAIESASAGDVLVADNRGRADESCIGDLMAQEAQTADLAGIVTLREQVRFGDYLAARTTNPALTFREHLRAVGGEIEV